MAFQILSFNSDSAYSIKAKEFWVACKLNHEYNLCTEN